MDLVVSRGVLIFLPDVGKCLREVERVLKPLGMNDTGWRPSAALRSRIAPTEVTPPRGYPVLGEVDR